MRDLIKVNDTTLLTQSKVYMIEGTLFRFVIHTDSIRHRQYIFQPLQGQRKTAELRLNQSKVYLKVYEVPSLYGQVRALVENEAIQLSLL